MPKSLNFKFYSSIVWLALLVGSALNPALNKALADTTAPTTTYSQTPSSPDGTNSWYKTPPQFTLTATDLESGIKDINYRINSGSWQTVSFTDTLNLVLNPSMETAAINSTGIQNWDATTVDAFGVYTKDVLNYAPPYANSSAKIIATSAAGTWHGINNQANYAVSTPYDNMTASAWIKTQSATGLVSFKIYAVKQDILGAITYSQIASSSSLTGTTGWTNLSTNFTVSESDAIGVYIDIGIDGTGTMWADAVNINSSTTSANTTFTVGVDGSSNRVEFYSTDNATNAETYSCSSPIKNCVTFKLDQTPPGNWNNSGAFRGFTGSNHELWVYTNVEDPTSGISTFTDKYMYYTERNPTFGRYSNLLNCNTTWQANTWTNLITPPFIPGANSAYLLTPKTDFCNSNWKICKIVRFYAQDMAGNNATKDFCINGPWVKVSGEGAVRSNNSIDMLSEAEGDNTDGLILAQGDRIDFFTSSKNWRVTETNAETFKTYDDYWNLASSKTQITDNTLKTTSGTWYFNGNLEITNSVIPSGFSTSVYNQVVFVNGDLKISADVTISGSSTLLFIVKGKVEVSKTVNNIHAGIFADGDLFTAYNINDGESAGTLFLKGIYSIHKYTSQRTLQGTDNSDTASEDFTYEPKYLVQLKNFFGNYKVTWE